MVTLIIGVKLGVAPRAEENDPGDFDARRSGKGVLRGSVLGGKGFSLLTALGLVQV